MNETELKEHIEKWEQISLEKGKNSNEAGKYYDKHILPYVEEAFVKDSKSLLKGKKYDGLILTVGGSPEPQILSLCAIAGQSTKVGLLYTAAAADSFNRICKRMEWKHDDAVTQGRKIDGSNTIEIYTTIMDLYTEWGKPAKIAVGITGGKKVMASAAAMAGAILGADIYYVDTDTKNKLNKPEPGSEYLRLLDNPYDVLGDIEADKAKELFRSHDYAGAKRIFNELVSDKRKRVGDPQKRAIYQIYEHLCAAYNAWDNFNVQLGSTELTKLLDQLEQSKTVRELSALLEFKSRLVNQREALEYLKNFVNKNTKNKLPYENSDRFHLAFTLYHSALRREIQAKFDLACLLLYRLLEWIGQCRLDKYNIDTGANRHDYSECVKGKTEESILCKYKEKRKKVMPHKPEKLSLPDGPIGLIDMYLLLYAMGDDLVEGLDWGKFHQQIETRNESIYIHGRNVVNKKAFDNFHKTVKDLFKKAGDLVCIDTDTFDEQHEFIRIP